MSLNMTPASLSTPWWIGLTSLWTGRKSMSYELASIYERYLPRFKQRYSRATSQDEWSAINAILGCRTPQYGEIALACDDCPYQRRTYCSCGHRACNQC
ncbi:transposase zinc-binding domain-containing protein [Brumicola pallidula]|uniref:transposase zinc-binding domain-containing protein n=2 Tax=Brumicola pallidula TaxID=56807 RepID=UPI003CC7E7AB